MPDGRALLLNPFERSVLLECLRAHTCDDGEREAQRQELQKFFEDHFTDGGFAR